MRFRGLPHSRRRCGWASRLWIVVGATVVALAAIDARATPLTLTAPSPTFFDSLAPDEVCVSPKTGLPGPQYINCRVASFLSLNDGVAFGLKNTLFDQAFNNWNNDGSWTLKDGGALPGGSLQVTNFRTVANRGGTIAGVDILVNWTYDGADKSDFLWTQGLYDNFKKDGTIGPSIYELDVRTDCDNADLTKLCGPAYPLQSEDRKFDDAPRAPWPDGSFAGFAYLSKVDRDKKVLTVYEGVVYGFSLSADPKPEVLPPPNEVPEPAPLTLVVTGMTSLWALRRRSQTRAHRPEAEHKGAMG